MIQSMTGFGRNSKKMDVFGQVSVEIRSINHKFLETVIHAPEGFLSIEDRIKKEIESKVQRGRITCVITTNGGSSKDAIIDEKLLKKYLASIKTISTKYNIAGAVNINNLINLPGVLSLVENRESVGRVWPALRGVIEKAVDDLVLMRQKEGKAIVKFLKERNDQLGRDIAMVKDRFAKVVKQKAARFPTDAERTAFLKESDINEEIERLEFHIHNFRSKLSSTGPIGKELDFISQEMQREANTMGAKSCDALISGRVVQIKSSIEKTREQLQNIV
ncbi:MAG: YicC family protein [Candidatus Omnitrophica bacterium]|jgi:uncharacterized protein (TIGR00255 family)|nr:YicC family protein [Candidatus Omnitrophota bacterium]